MSGRADSSSGDQRDDGCFVKSSSSSAVNTIVSVLIPGEENGKYLMVRHGDRGWWLPYGKVHRYESIKLAAVRIATEVSSSWFGY